MATATVATTSTISPPINFDLQEIYLAQADQRCVYPSLCDPGEWSTHSGSNFTMKWLRVDQQTPTTTALTELTGALVMHPRTSSTPAVTSITATLVKYGDYFLLNEEIDFTNPSKQSIKLMQTLGAQAGRSLNRLARDQMEDNLTQRRVGGVGADADIVAPITLDAITGTVSVLDTNSATRFTEISPGSEIVGSSPIFEAYRGVCHTYVRYNIERLSGFKGAETYASHVALMPGEFGYVNGVRWQSTEEASQGAGGGGANAALYTTSSAVDLFDSIIVGQGAVGSAGRDVRHPDKTYTANDPPATIELIHKPRGTSGIMDPFNELETMAWKMFAVFTTLNSNWGRRLTSGATRFQ